ncbi:MAG: SCPU domain-containing protein, partial [Acidobacteria bacterium]
MKRTILSLIALTAFAVSVPAFAGSASANLNISASVAAVCTIT